jgi:excisionase family DNA binding protein
MNAREAATYLQVSPRTISFWARSGKLPGHRLSGSAGVSWRFLRFEICSAPGYRRIASHSRMPILRVGYQRVAKAMRTGSRGSDSNRTDWSSLADQIEQTGHALTAKELGVLLAVSQITIFKHAKAGRIPSFRIGTCVRFDPRAIATWLRRQ